MNYTLIDTYTGQEFPANDVYDIEQYVDYILSGQELTDHDKTELGEFFFEVTEYGASFSNALGLEVVPHV